MAKVNPYNYGRPTFLGFGIQIQRVGFTNTFNVLTNGNYEYSVLPSWTFTKNKTITAPFGIVNLAVKDMLGRVMFVRIANALAIACENFNDKIGQFLVDNQVFGMQHADCTGNDFI